MAGDPVDRDEDGPERSCIVTRAKGAPETMLRFVAGPDGAVVPDVRRRLPGRGVWVGASQALVAEAVKRQLFSRGLKTKAVAEPSLSGVVDDLLAADALQSLAMANKAGAVTTGFFKVEAALAAGEVAALMHANDAAEDGIRKLAAAQRRHGRPCPTAEDGVADAAIKVFSSEQLDLALGRTNVIHAALAEGPAGNAFLVRCRRLVRYRSAPASEPEGRSDMKGRAGRSA